MYPHKKICGYKNLRRRVDGALVRSITTILITTQISRFLFKKLSFCSSDVNFFNQIFNTRYLIKCTSVNELSIEDITRWREDMNSISSGKTIFYEGAQRVSKILFFSCFCNEKIKSVISSSRRVMFFLLYRQKDIDKMIDFYSAKGNCDGSNLQYSDIRHCLQ